MTIRARRAHHRESHHLGGARALRECERIAAWATSVHREIGSGQPGKAYALR